MITRRYPTQIPQEEQLKNHEITPDLILGACAIAFGVSNEEVKDKNNLSHRVCWARHSCWLMLNKVKRHSYGTIAADYDFSRPGVRHGIKTIQRMAKSNSFIMEGINEAAKILRCVEFVSGFMGA